MRKFSKIVDVQPVMFADGTAAIANLQRVSVRDDDGIEQDSFFITFCDTRAGNINIDARISAMEDSREIGTLKTDIITAFAPKPFTTEAGAALFDALCALRIWKTDRLKGIEDARR